MKFTWKNLLTISLLTLALAGCQQAEQAAEATKEKATEAAKTADGMATEAKDKATGVMDQAKDMLAGLDFSSPEKITATVIPAITAMLGKEPTLAGLKLDATLKDKVLSVTGDVKNNDQKRKIDEVLKPLIDKAKEAGFNFLNGAVVKG